MTLDEEVSTEQYSGDNSELNGEYMVFWMDSQAYALPVCNVVQIIKTRKITEIPEYPNYAKGIINFRDAVIPVISLRLLFSKDEIPWDQRTCIIVTGIKDRYAGVVVDEADEVIHIEDKDISGIPGVSEKRNSGYLKGIAKYKGRAILLLNPELILS